MMAAWDNNMSCVPWLPVEDKIDVNQTFGTPMHVTKTQQRLRRNLTPDFYIVVEYQADERSPVEFECSKKLASYFSARINDDLLREDSDRYSISGYPIDAIWRIVEYFYTNTILITKANALVYLDITDFLKMQKLFQTVLDYLRTTIDIFNCLNVKLVFDRILTSSSDIQALNYFIAMNFSSISKTEEFLATDFETLLAVVKMNNIVCNSEEEIYLAVMRWFEANKEERLEFLSPLIMEIRLALMNLNNLKVRMHHEIYLFKDVDLKLLKEECINYIVSRCKKIKYVMLEEKHCRPRIYRVTLITDGEPIVHSLELPSPSSSRTSSPASI